MNYFLVDFENVRTDGMKDMMGVKEGDAMVIFYSEQCKNITLDVIENITRLKLQLSTYKAKVGTKNALDFQLSSHHKTKQDICNGMSKQFKDSKKASAIYKKLKPLLKEKNKS